MANGSGNVSNILSIGGFDAAENLTIPESNGPGYFTLYAQVGTSGMFSPFFRDGVQYQVATGKTCKVTKILATCTTTGESFQLVSATATFAANAASITGGVYQLGAAGLYIPNTTTALVAIGYSLTYQFTALTFPGFQANSGGSSVMLICKEV